MRAQLTACKNPDGTAALSLTLLGSSLVPFEPAKPQGLCSLVVDLSRTQTDALRDLLSSPTWGYVMAPT